MSIDERTELIYRIALTMAPAVGPVTARKLIKEMGSASAILTEKNLTALQKIHGIGKRMSTSLHNPFLLEEAEKELEFIDKHDISALYFQDPEYPHRLNECSDAPILLYVKGMHCLNCQRSLSVVGTRRATSYGKELCRKIVKGLASEIKDLVIVSGLAYGIDVIGHRAALEAGIPTLGVLGHGMRCIYPSSHRETAIQISKQGALVTDFHSGMGPERNNFLRRNRIIAGLADATLVVESAKTGGALITAGIASSYGRDILAVPGRAGDLRSEGCNKLIKSTLAALVESHEDVIRHLNWQEGYSSMTKPSEEVLAISGQEKQLLELISTPQRLNPDHLSRQTGIPIQQVLSLLIGMELKQWIDAEPGNFYRSRVNLT